MFEAALRLRRAVMRRGEAEASPLQEPLRTGCRRRPAAGAGPPLVGSLIGVARTLAEALDAFAGEGDAVEGFAVLFPLGLAHRAGGEDEVALGDIAIDVAAGGVAEDGDFVPACALDPIAVIVATAMAGGNLDAQR